MKVRAQHILDAAKERDLTDEEAGWALRIVQAVAHGDTYHVDKGVLEFVYLPEILEGKGDFDVLVVRP